MLCVVQSRPSDLLVHEVMIFKATRSGAEAPGYVDVWTCLWLTLTQITVMALNASSRRGR
jgi:hypothetical protein